MFPPMELDGGQNYYVKPMNCPFHILVVKSRQRSYREFPLRLFEFGSVYRYEKSGVVHGLTRVRGMTQDDAHIFCTREQMEDELHSILSFVLDLLGDFGLDDFYLELSTKPEGKAVGTDEEWDEATAALRNVALARDLDLVLDEGGGAFYGPKISVQARDAIGRTHQMSTIQLDFQEPQRFDMEYVGADNARHRPIMIHRALFGSVERFFAILLEHYAGNLPTWLAPEQVRVLPVADAHQAYADEVASQLHGHGLRVEVHGSEEMLGARIGKAKVQKIPYIAGGRGRGRGRPHSRGQPPGRQPACPGRAPGRLRGHRGPRGRDQELARAGRPGRVTGPGGERALEHLWAGWRHQYVAEATAAERAGEADGCVFCRLAASGAPSVENLVVWRGERAFAALNLYPYGSGHLLVLPVRHEDDLARLDDDESAELWAAVRAGVAAVQAAYQPDGVNLGANLGRAAGAGIPAHLHVHVVPRWSGDTNFMTSVAGVRVLPEPLSVAWRKVTEAWPEGGP